MSYALEWVPTDDNELVLMRSAGRIMAAFWDKDERQLEDVSIPFRMSDSFTKKHSILHLGIEKFVFPPNAKALTISFGALTSKKVRIP